MSKKQALAPEAERLYIQEGMTFEGIAGTLGIAEKTVRLWKDEGGWEEKRRSFLKGKEQFHQELFGLARKLAEQIKTSLNDMGKPLDGGRVRLFVSILDKLDVVKGYEDVVRKVKDDPALRKAGSDLATAIREELLKGDEE